MNNPGKLSLLVILTFIALSFSSCFVRQNPHKKWTSRPNRAYWYGRHHNHAGRHLWVRNKYTNTH